MLGEITMQLASKYEAPTSKTVLLSFNTSGEWKITMKRGNEIKSLYLDPSYAEEIYVTAQKFHASEDGWTAKQFDDYWNHGGEEQEIKQEGANTVDVYNDQFDWDSLN